LSFTICITSATVLAIKYSCYLVGGNRYDAGVKQFLCHLSPPAGGPTNLVRTRPAIMAQATRTTMARTACQRPPAPWF